MNCPIIFDLETTGLSPKEEDILQVAIIDIFGNTLFNEYIRPTKRTEWPEATKINDITPEMVEGCKTFSVYRSQIQEIFNKCDGYITYNGTFDMKFLEENGITIPKLPHLDVMKSFALIWGDKKGDSYKWQKLTTAAKYYGIEFNAHNALADSEATRQVALKVYGSKLGYDPAVTGKVKWYNRLKDIVLLRRFKKFLIKRSLKK